MPFGGLLTLGVTAGTSILGGILGSSASSKAAKLQSDAANKVAGMATDASGKAIAGVNAATTGIDKTISGTYAPYLNLGTQGATSLSAALQPGGPLTQQFSFNPSNIQNDPGYQFQLSEGLKALERSAAARGELLGGGTLKAITQYGEGLAGTEFQNAYNRAANTFQMNRQNNLQALNTLLGYGSNAANNFSNIYANTNLRGAEEAGQFGLQGVDIAGRALTGGANAQAAGTVGAANAWNSALGGVANAGQFYSMSQMLNPGTVSGPGMVSSSSPYGSLSDLVTPGTATPPLLPPPAVGPASYNSMAPNWSNSNAY